MNLFFFLFASITVLSAIAVISSRNPVHSVLFLILAFVNSAGLFVLAGAEFLAMILLIVYVGAVAVLFLFVVMMLNINLEEMKYIIIPTDEFCSIFKSKSFKINFFSPNLLT